MRKRIAILGGGMSSLVTAFELTGHAGWRSRYDLTVYQEGWRLGGKGASGRNAEMGQRIEEHGLHILFGFYDNAFRTMRECYAELGRNPGQPLATWKQAFEPQDLVVMEEHLGDEWVPWAIEFPRNSAEPGDPGPLLSPWDYVLMLLDWAGKAFYQSRVGPVSGVAVDELLGALGGDRHRLRGQANAAISGASRPRSRRGVARIFDELRDAWHDFKHGARAAVDLVSGEAAEALHLGLALALAKSMPTDPREHAPGDQGALVWLVNRFRSWLHGFTDGADLRRLRVVVNFTLAMVRGLIEDRVIFPPHDYFALDEMDLSAWLKKHGASEETLASPVVRGPYDAAFAGFNQVGAGTGVHGILRMAFTYKGAVLWKMQAGMGDTIFTPLYEVLRRRGVTFEYFHQVNRLELSADKSRVERVHMTVQAETKDGADYRPLVNVKGLPCWPDRPLYDQLVQGDELRQSGADLEDWWTRWPGVGQRVIEVERDFDQVVLGISIGSLPQICRELYEDQGNPRFAAMCDAVKTTQTRAAQLWFRPDLAGLGWQGKPPIVIPYAEPFDTWSDMTHLLEREEWPDDAVGNLAYLCSPLPDDEPIPPRDDHDYPARQRQRVRDELEQWLRRYTGGLWPTATDTDDPRALNPWFLFDPDDRDGWARLAAQYWRATVSPSDRYVLSVPGSVAHRLAPDESGYDNLVLTGDWTKNFMSVGCLECAVAAGLLAARAIEPRVRPALGDWLSDLDAPPERRQAPSHTPPAPELPRWISRDNDQIAFAPVGIDVTVYMFLLAADYHKLAAMCDRELNRDGDTVYQPLAPFVCLYASRVDNFPQVKPIGWVPELDFGIWVPLLAGPRHGSAFVPDRLVTYTPYIWVNNGVALIGGRTVFGFVKELGRMSMPKGPGDPAHFTLDSLVVDKYGPEARAQERRVLEIEHASGGVWSELEAMWQGAEALLDGAAEAVEELFTGHGSLPIPTFSGARAILDQMAHGMRMVFLKQFPDDNQPERACYQAVVEADLPITGDVHGGWLPGDYEVRLHRYDSVRIADTLGLRTGGGNGDVTLHHPAAAGWSRFHSVVQPGSVIWKRP